MAESLHMDQTFIRKLTDIILANIHNENFGVADLATAAGISRITIYRRLRFIRNQGASQFIREIRLQRAMELLKQNAGTVSEIAFMVGFGSPAYFNKCFHEFFGFPPGQVKKEGFSKHVEMTPDQGMKVQSGKRAQWLYFAIISSVILFLALLLYVIILNKNFYTDKSNQINSSEKSIAIVPFINDSSSDSTTYFINGVMDEILNNLQRISAFSKVISRTSAEQYRGSKKAPLPKIAKELNVNYIVEGSGQKYGKTFRLSVRLFNAKKDIQIWSKSYEEKIQDATDICKIQTQVAETIAAELKTTITPEEKQLIEKNPTVSLTAYDYYQRGKQEEISYTLYNPFTSSLLNKQINKKALERAEKMYRSALRYDSSFAKAYIGLATVYINKHYFEEYFSKEFLDSVIVFAKIALSFDDRLAEAYRIRGWYYAEKGYFKQSLAEYDKAIKLNPNDWITYYGKGELFLNEADNLETIRNLLKAAILNNGPELPGLLREISIELAYNGFIDQAKLYNLEALKLDGDSVRYYSYLASFVHVTHNYDNTIEFLKKGYEIDSTDLAILSDLGFYYSYIKRFKESLKYFKKYIDTKTKLGLPDKIDLNRMHRIGYTLWENGYRDEANVYFDKQIEFCNEQIKLGRPYASRLLFTYYDLAAVYAFRGDNKNAYKNLVIFNHAERFHFAWKNILKYDPLFYRVKNDPEFQKIGNEIDSKAQAEHERIRKWLEANNML